MADVELRPGRHIQGYLFRASAVDGESSSDLLAWASRRSPGLRHLRSWWGECIASSPTGAARVAMLEYVEKLTRSPRDMVESDVENLRSVGYTDRDILDIATVTAYYAYVNRIADGLGVDLET